jgi:hypothetical protein
VLTPTAAKADTAPGDYYCTNGKIAAGKNNPTPTLTVSASAVVDGRDCTGDVVVPAGVTVIDNEAFRDNIQITSVSIPSSVTYISEQAFLRTKALTSVTFTGESRLSQIGLSAFEGAKVLQNIDLPKSLLMIGMHSFFGTGSLSVYNYCGPTIPDSDTGLVSPKTNSCDPVYDPKAGTGNVGLFEWIYVH